MKDFVECVGDIDVQEVRYEHGERFIQDCLAQNVSAATTTKKVKHLKRVFQLAEDRGRLDRHPFRRLKPPKVSKRKIRVSTDQECDNLCRIARQYEEKGSRVKWELLIRMCLGTGMRRGELMNTAWRNIDHHLNKIRRRAGIKDGTFHDLRRTCLSNWVVQGLSLHEVKELAGHAGIETTERFYLAIRKDVVDRARAASEASRKGQSVARPMGIGQNRKTSVHKFFTDRALESKVPEPRIGRSRTTSPLPGPINCKDRVFCA